MTERQTAIAREAMRRHPESFADAIGVDVSENTPAPLFQWLVGCLLCSARISAAQAERASRALFEAGWTTPEKMGAAGWEARVKVLNENGYARFDEKTSGYLGEMVELLQERWKGDLRNLREEAGRDPRRELRLIQEFKGIGALGAGVFMREMQIPWEEAWPFADDRTLETARALGLPGDAAGLAKLLPRKDFPRLLDALVRVELADEVEAVRDAV